MSLPILIINCTVPTLLFLNHAIVGECSPEKPSLSLPMSEGNYYFGVVPLCEGYTSFWSGMTVQQGRIRFHREGLRLHCWHGNIFEWNLCPEKTAVAFPPAVLSEVRWGSRTAGLCGEYLLVEHENGHVEHRNLGRGFGGGELAVLSTSLLLVCGEKKQLLVVNGQLETVLERNILDWSTEKGRLHFSEDMDMISGYRYSENYLCGETLTLQDSMLEYAEGHPRRNIPEEAIRALCEAVRLSLEEQTLACLTPSLKERISFSEICTFLGSFIGFSPVKYMPNSAQESIALLYETEDGEYRYTCYKFSVAEDTDGYLIDDIQEL